MFIDACIAKLILLKQHHTGRTQGRVVREHRLADRLKSAEIRS